MAKNKTTVITYDPPRKVFRVSGFEDGHAIYKGLMIHTRLGGYRCNLGCQ